MTKNARYVLLPLLALVFLGCGDVPVHRYNYGNPVSFAFTDEGITPVSRSIVTQGAPRSVSSRALAPAVVYPDYIQGPLTATEIQAQRDAAGTFIRAYTPDVFRIPMVKIGMLSSEESDGFWIILGNEGIGVGEQMEFFDFIEPVYVTDDLLWQRFHYDILFSEFELGVSDIGGNNFQADIQVEAPGYTDADMPDLYLGTKGTHREYLGSNRFAVTAGELFLNAGVQLEDQTYLPSVSFPGFYPTMLIFRDYVSGDGIYRLPDPLMMTDYPFPDSATSSEYGYNFDDPFWDPLRTAYMNNNEWASSHAYGPTNFSPTDEVWADLPFPGLTVAEDTTELRVTIRWDLDNIIELWDYDEGGLHFQLAADFMERFSVIIEQF